MSDSGPTLPHVRFTQRTLPNGLRVIVAPDRLAPVVAINLWYDVGSKHEVKGKTGFAHLFEHFMFQGSRHVAKAEHMALIQGAGGINNATTFFDRTNYFETLPSHQLELGLWLEADRMATLLDALSQENLDNQREVVKNEKRQSYDNRPYGSFYEKLMAAVFPDGHPYHHTPIGSMADLDAASLDDVIAFFKTWYAPNNAVLTIAGDVDEEPAFAAAETLLRAHPGQPGPAALDAARGGAGHRRRRRARWWPRPCRWCASTSAGASRRTARTRSTRSRSAPTSWPAAAAAGCTGAWSATSAWPRTWPRSRCRSSPTPRSWRAGSRSGPTRTRPRRSGCSWRRSSAWWTSRSPTTSWPAPARWWSRRSWARCRAWRRSPTACRSSRSTSTGRSSSTSSSSATSRWMPPPSRPSRGRSSAPTTCAVITYVPAEPAEEAA